MKTGIIDVGGGQRGIYAAGVLDYCMDKGITFDVGIGVSAGSANLSSFVARQRGRNYKFYTEYSMRDEYMSVQNVRTKGCFLDVNYIYGTLSNEGGEYPLDYRAYVENPTDLIVVATEAETGYAKYFSKGDLKTNHYEVLMASSAIPHVCNAQTVDHISYFDGALSDPVPVALLSSLGCDAMVLLLTKPIDTRPYPSEDIKLAAKIEQRYPQAAKKLCLREDAYQQGVKLAQKYAEEGKLLIVAPETTCGVTTLSRDLAALNMLYTKGYADGERIEEFLKAFG